MTAIRKQGKINNDTTMIDINMMGVPGVTAMYLIESGKKCIIEGGTHTENRKIVRQLKDLNFFPPDMIIVTHSHWDHTQAIPLIMKRAEKEGKKIEILASAAAIPNLKDQSYNEVFGVGTFENIEADVVPLKEGDTVDLEGITLEIYETTGHTNDHIAILDTKNKNIFVGDAIGDKVADNVFIPTFMPPYWDKEAFFNTINKLKKIDYKTLSLTHFGCIYNAEAKTILDEAVSVYEKWWNLYEENVDKLDDMDYMTNKLFDQNLIPKDVFSLFPEMLIHGTITWLAMGFRISKNIPLPSPE
jgi:glyoxylase-like metal-dependent hydrolase (beta-lactamase superfamily II)